MPDQPKVTSDFFKDWNFDDPVTVNMLVEMQRDVAVMVTNEIIDSVRFGFEIDTPGEPYIDMLIGGTNEICGVKNHSGISLRDDMLHYADDYGGHPDDNKKIKNWIAWFRETADQMEEISNKQHVAWMAKHGAKYEKAKLEGKD